ncbi:hypothetical protein AUJ27_00875 [Candidatus Falkowbacteria bacterium CG1_02_37_44]|uniref:Antitoxin n=1 Tax=Candidatus Falkowbacteria bacterium CG1_02_37_44 TaxID=1805146 RepID=A0A1J4T9D3_9BACT|nr:MAG: hypothetical protein AUJ27_00875 [Candidatus Falkowbacteria bacterium CG1_02_37_44]
MNTISISDLKVNPSKAISFASDYPIAIENRNKIKAYLLGKDLYEKLVSYVEQMIDKKAVEETDFNKGRDFETVAKKLNV